MFNTDLQRTATAIVGALAFTIMTVGAAVGPARAVETAPVVIAHGSAPVAVSANV